MPTYCPRRNTPPRGDDHAHDRPADPAAASGQVSAEEWQTRVDLAAAYRLVALFRWDDLVFTHISARVPGRDDEFLINPYGLMFEEITASSLVQIDTAGNKLDDSPFPVNPAGFTIHSAVHAARHDAQCVLHTHTLNGIAVSAQKGGVLPLSQQSIFVLSQPGLPRLRRRGAARRREAAPGGRPGRQDLPDAAQPRPADASGATIADAFLNDVPVRDRVHDPGPRAGRQPAS